MVSTLLILYSADAVCSDSMTGVLEQSSAHNCSTVFGRGQAQLRLLQVNHSKR